MFIAALALSLAVQAQAENELRSFLDGFEALHFSGVVYVEVEGKEVFFHSVGHADRESKRPFTRETGLEIGSIVKPVVRVAVLRLAEQGKLKMSDTIGKYFKDVPKDKSMITLKMLAEHTSGFPDFFGEDYSPMQRDELMKKMLGSKLLFEPGSQEEYSNAGYSMLATVIEKVTGEGIEQHVTKTQFRPIGIKRFGYVLPKWKPEETTVGYGRVGQRWGTPLDKFWYEDGPSWNLRGNGGMIARAQDMATWCFALHNGKLLNPDSYASMVPSWSEQKPSEGAVWGAAGGNGFFNTILGYNPHRKLVIVAASTDSRFVIERQWRDLIRKVFAVADEKAGR